MRPHQLSAVEPELSFGGFPTRGLNWALGAQVFITVPGGAARRTGLVPPPSATSSTDGGTQVGGAWGGARRNRVGWRREGGPGVHVPLSTRGPQGRSLLLAPFAPSRPATADSHHFPLNQETAPWGHPHRL